MCERGAKIFMAIGAQRIDAVSLRLLSMRIVAGLTLNAGGSVLAGAPLIRRRFMARRAQRRIRRDGHLDLRMVRLIGSVT